MTIKKCSSYRIIALKLAIEKIVIEIINGDTVYSLLGCSQITLWARNTSIRELNFQEDFKRLLRESHSNFAFVRFVIFQNGCCDYVWNKIKTFHLANER